MYQMRYIYLGTSRCTRAAPTYPKAESGVCSVRKTRGGGEREKSRCCSMLNLNQCSCVAVYESVHYMPMYCHLGIRAFEYQASSNSRSCTSHMYQSGATLWPRRHTHHVFPCRSKTRIFRHQLLLRACERVLYRFSRERAGTRDTTADAWKSRKKSVAPDYTVHYR